MTDAAVVVDLQAIPHDDDRHHAFTSLVAWRGALWCGFRSGGSHVSHDGVISVWTRRPGGAWQPAFVLPSPDPARPDLRDPSLLVVDDRLTVIATATRRRPDESCRTWRWPRPIDDRSAAEPLGPVGWWLWSAALTGDELIMGAYTTPGLGADDHRAAVWRAPASGGEATMITELDRGSHRPNEVAVAPDPAGGWRCLVRCEGGSAELGHAASVEGPWRLSEVGCFVGGPAMLPVGDRLVVAGRAHRPRREVVAWTVTGAGTLRELSRLPSGGDCGYPAIVATDGELVISYHTSHDGPTGVRVATLRPG